MKYQKSQAMQGEWVKASEVENGVLATLVSETSPIQGEYGTQDVAKIRFKGDENSKNVRLNKTTINGLIDAFGDDSKNWVNKVLTTQTEKALVGGKRVTILYLIPENFELREDSNGYMVITNKTEGVGGKKADELETVEYLEEESKADDIPF